MQWRRFLRFGLGIAALTATSGHLESRNIRATPTYAGLIIHSPPDTLKLDPFYTRYVDALGIPIVSSSKVSDDALLVARDIVNDMLAQRPDVRRALIAEHMRVAVMAIDESTTDLPEQRNWKKPQITDPMLPACDRKFYQDRIGRYTDKEYWNRRARGMGGMLTSAAAENLLGVPGTRYYGENIMVHEFSHAIFGILLNIDPDFSAAVVSAYKDAIRENLWKGQYAATSVAEYWAEGTQFWFNSNNVSVIDGNVIISDSDLARHDPKLYALLGRVFGDLHHLPSDIFYMHPARVPVHGVPLSTGEVC